MPFRSKRQQRLFFATMPELAHEWAEKTDFSKLPEKVRKKKKKSECDDASAPPKKKKSKNDKALQMAAEFERQVKASLKTELGSSAISQLRNAMSEIEKLLKPKQVLK